MIKRMIIIRVMNEDNIVLLKHDDVSIMNGEE